MGSHVTPYTYILYEIRNTSAQNTLTRDPMTYIITSFLYLSASLPCWMSLSKALSLHLLHCQHMIAHAYLADL